MNTLELLDAIRGHLAAYELPATASVLAAACGRDLTVQLDSPDLPEVAAGLLMWADTLTDLTVEVWRPAHGGTVHLGLLGRLPGGTRVRIYGAVAYHPAVFGRLALHHGATVPICLGVLREWADLAVVTP